MATKSNGKPGKDSGEPGKLKEYQPGQAFNGVLSLAAAPGWGRPSYHLDAGHASLLVNVRAVPSTIRAG